MRFPNLTPPLLCGVLACGAPVEQPDTAPPATRVWPAIFAELVDGPFPEVAVPMDDEALVFGVDPQDGGVGWRLSIDGLCARPLDPEVQVLSASSSNANWAGGGLDGRLLLGTEGTDGTVERADLPSLDPVVGVWRGGSETWAVTARVYGQTGNLWRLRTGQDWELMAVDQPGPFHGAWNRWFIGDGVAWYWDGIALVDRAPRSGPHFTPHTAPRSPKSGSLAVTPKPSCIDGPPAAGNRWKSPQRAITVPSGRSSKTTAARSGSVAKAVRPVIGTARTGSATSSRNRAPPTPPSCRSTSGWSGLGAGWTTRGRHPVSSPAIHPETASPRFPRAHPDRPSCCLRGH